MRSLAIEQSSRVSKDVPGTSFKLVQQHHIVILKKIKLVGHFKVKKIDSWYLWENLS